MGLTRRNAELSPQKRGTTFALLAGRTSKNAVIHIGARMPLRKALAK